MDFSLRQMEGGLTAVLFVLKEKLKGMSFFIHPTSDDFPIKSIDNKHFKGTAK